MHEYDTALKTFLRNGPETLAGVTSVPVAHWHNVELPEVHNRRVDPLGESADGRLVHIELQSTNDPNMAVRTLEYSAAVFRRFGRFAEQVVLYVGEPALKMTASLSGRVSRLNFGSSISANWTASVCSKASRSVTMLLPCWRECATGGRRSREY